MLAQGEARQHFKRQIAKINPKQVDLELHAQSAKPEATLRTCTSLSGVALATADATAGGASATEWPLSGCFAVLTCCKGAIAACTFAFAPVASGTDCICTKLALDSQANASKQLVAMA